MAGAGLGGRNEFNRDWDRGALANGVMSPGHESVAASRKTGALRQ